MMALVEAHEARLRMEERLATLTLSDMRSLRCWDTRP